MKYDGKILNTHQMIDIAIDGKACNRLSREIGLSKNAVRNWQNGIEPKTEDFEKLLEVCGYEIRIVKKSEWISI